MLKHKSIKEHQDTNKTTNQDETIQRICSSTSSHFIVAPDGVDQGTLNEVLARAMNSMQPGTPQEQQGAMDDLKVVLINGPLECEDEDRIKPQKYVSVEYVGTIAEGSETGEIGKILYSSFIRGQTLDFQQHSIGQVPRGFDFATNGLCLSGC